MIPVHAVESTSEMYLSELPHKGGSSPSKYFNLEISCHTCLHPSTAMKEGSDDLETPIPLLPNGEWLPGLVLVFIRLGKIRPALDVPTGSVSSSSPTVV